VVFMSLFSSSPMSRRNRRRQRVGGRRLDELGLRGGSRTDPGRDVRASLQVDETP
jgi:hypothetical protein